MCKENVKAKHIFSDLLVMLLLSCVVTSVFAAAKIDVKKSFGYSSRYGVVTPTQVYSTIQNYQAIFAYYIQTHKKEFSVKVNAVEFIAIQNKTPNDVFNMVSKLSDALDKLSRREQLGPMKRVTRESANKAIPAEVLFQAGYNLDAFVSYMNKIESGNNWGRYYVSYKYTKNKNPSDVYALADLTLRRLQAVFQ